MAAQEIHDLYIIYVSKFAQKQYRVVENGLESVSHIKDEGAGGAPLIRKILDLWITKCPKREHLQYADQLAAAREKMV